MSQLEFLRTKREEILRLAMARGAIRARVFGSVARNQESESSDVDFLVELKPGTSLIDHASLIVDIERLLGKKVDVITERGLRPRIRGQVISEAVAL